MIRLVTSLAGLAGLAMAVAAGGAAGAAGESGGLTLVGQSPWVIDGPQSIDVRISGSNEQGALVFQLGEAVDHDGLHHPDDATWTPVGGAVVVPLAGQLDASGVVSTELTIGPDADLHLSADTVALLEIRLIDGDGMVVDALTTPVIRLSADPPAAVRTSLSIRIAGPPPLQPDGSLSFDEATLAHLRALADASGAHPGVPVDAQLPPATIVALARSGEMAHAELIADLEAAAAASLHLRSAPFVTVDPEAWRQFDDGDVYRDLLDHGDAVLADHLGGSVDRTVTTFEPTASAGTVGLLVQLGSTAFIVDSGHLMSHSADAVDTGPGPVLIRDDADRLHPAIVVDAGLVAHLSADAGPVAAVQNLLADLALSGWHGPTDAMVPLVVDAEVGFDTQLLDVLLDVLDDAPFIDLVPVADMFAHGADPTADGTAGYELWPDAVVPITERAVDRLHVDRLVDAYETIRGGADPDIAALRMLVETLAASELDETQAAGYMDAIHLEMAAVADLFQGAENQNLRLTTRHAEVPFTIDNGLDVPAAVLFELTSDGRLEFPDGPSMAVTLQPGTNRVPISIEARASGDARLHITVRSPDPGGLLLLETAQVTVRTTKLSGVGVLLLVAALVVLVVWWVRSARARRSAGTTLSPTTTEQ